MNKKTFCIYPFIHISTERNGAYTACGASQCYSKHNVYTDDVETAWNDEFFTQLRLDGVNGVRSDNCAVCWYHEDHGTESRRQRANIAYEHLMPLTVEQVNEQQGIIEQLPVQINARVENICNLKCITCNHYHSSQHEKEVDEFKEQGIVLPKWFAYVDKQNTVRINPEISKKGKVTDNLKAILNKSVKLEIEGGEPLLAPMTQEILDYCIANGQTDITMEMVSNLTSITDETLEKLTHFTNLSIWASWDHIEAERFRYIRYPANYEQFLSVFEKVAKIKTLKLGVSFTTSVFNIYAVTDILDQFEQLAQQDLINGYIIFRHVFMPDYFSSTYLEPEQKQELVAKLRQYRIDNAHYKILQHRDVQVIMTDLEKILSTTPDNFDEIVKERTRMLDIYDKSRRTNYQELFPYIKRYN